MHRIRLCYSTVLLVCLSTIFFGCQTQSVKGERPEAIPKSAWATIDFGLRRNASGFPSRLSVTAIDSLSLRLVGVDGVRLHGKVSCRERNSCILHPGSHSVEFDYVWSKIETVDQQKKKGRSEAISAMLAIFGGGPEVARYQNSLCHISIEFESQEAKYYALNVIHSDGQKEPDGIQVVDKETGVVAGSQSQCDLKYATALPYSGESVPIDQCAIHLISSISSPMTFYLNDSHPYYAYHMNHTLLVEPGEQVIKVRYGLISPTAKPKNTSAILVKCSGGAAKYIQVNKDRGFWSTKLTLGELSVEEGQLIDKTVLR
jgi:hypothetical protein